MSGVTISSADRLSMTLFLAVVVHALIILGIGFSTDLPKPRREAPLIEITLADNPVEQAPDQYDYLAQANQDGGGRSQKRERPRKAEQALVAGEPDGQQQLQAAAAPTPPPQARRQQVVSTQQARRSAPARTAETAPDQPEPTAVDLINASRQVAQWSAFQENRESVLAKFPNKRRIDARTKSHAAAAYMRDWIEKVEQIGNLNYPDEARRRNLSGSLILEVTLRPDGSLHDLRVLQPSRHPVLDQAALRTVRLAAPFAPVPESVLQGDDLLVITRTWEYLDAGSLSTR